MIAYGFSFRQVTARNPSDQTRQLFNQALDEARAITAIVSA